MNGYEHILQMLEQERETLKVAQKNLNKDSNEQVTELVRQIIYLRKQLEIQKPDITHVHNLKQEEQRKKRSADKKMKNEKCSSVPKQFSI